jgi:hypothetical protein
MNSKYGVSKCPLHKAKSGVLLSSIVVPSSFYTFYFYPFCAPFLFYFLRHPGATANDIYKKGTDRGKGVHFFCVLSSACDAPRGVEALGGFPNASAGVCEPCLDGCLFLHRFRLVITQIKLM